MVSAALIISLVVFGIYYVADRYAHPADRSPMEAGIERMEQAVRRDPENVERRSALAEAYLTAGRYRDALEQAQQVLSLYPDNAGALLIAGIACTRLDRPAAALEPLNRFIGQRQDRPTANADQALEAAYYFAGESYLALNRPADAIPVLEAALAINRTDADALYQLGLAYHATGQAQMAAGCYQRAVRLVPDFAAAYQAMVPSYTTLGQLHAVAYARGMQAYCAGDYESALRYLEQATTALPDFGPAFLGMGLTYERMGKLGAALQAVERAYDLDPDDLASRQAIGRIRAALD